MPFPVAAIPAIVAAIQGGSQMLTASANRKAEQRNYDRMLEYNKPKNQMARFAEGGLSPYLMYGQGNAGNASSPRPADVIENPTPRGLDSYMSAASFMEDIKAKRLQNAILGNEVSRSHWRTISEGLNSTRKELDMLSEYPGYTTWQDYSKTRYRAGTAPHVSDARGYTQQLNELKLGLSKLTMEKIRQSIAGMSSENVVKGVKAHYASEYGMVGGDWTQGLGLLKSLPSFFKSKAKSGLPAHGKLPGGNQSWYERERAAYRFNYEMSKRGL